MLTISRCSWCNNYIGLKDGWLPACKAYPDGQPVDFEPDYKNECNNNFGFVVKPEKKKKYNELFN